MRLEVCRLIERLEPDHAGNDVENGDAGVAQAELGHRLGWEIEQRHYQALERAAVADQDYIALWRSEVRLPDEAPASFDNVRQQFAAGGLKRRVACEVLADPRAVFDL